MLHFTGTVGPPITPGVRKRGMELVVTPRTHHQFLLPRGFVFSVSNEPRYPHYMFLHTHLDIHGQIYAESEPLDVHPEFAPPPYLLSPFHSWSIEGNRNSASVPGRPCCLDGLSSLSFADISILSSFLTICEQVSSRDIQFLTQVP